MKGFLLTVSSVQSKVIPNLYQEL